MKMNKEMIFIEASVALVSLGFILSLAALVSLLLGCGSGAGNLTMETPDLTGASSNITVWHDTGSKKAWQSAKDYCSDLNSHFNGITKINGIAGWHLPSVSELKTKCGSTSGEYWSSENKLKPGPDPSSKPAGLSSSIYLVEVVNLADCSQKTVETGGVDEFYTCVTNEGREQGSDTGRGDYRRTVEYTGNWGDWTGSKYCPSGSWAGGLEQRVESSQGDGDDSSLNSIAFYCLNKNGAIVGRICPHEGWWGDWSSIYKCNSYGSGSQFITSIFVKDESPQGNEGDDTSMNAVWGMCGSSVLLRPSNEGNWGEWTNTSFTCSEGEAICGLKIRLESDQAGGDDTAMNGIAIHCCAVN